MTKRCLVLVEGQTEEIFVNAVLQPHLEQHDYVSVKPVVIATKRRADGGNHRGGVMSWPRTKGEIKRLLGKGGAVVTTMFDLYGLPDDWPGTDAPATGIQKAEAIEAAIERELDTPNLIAYLQVHEFEALVYAKPSIVSEYLDMPDLRQQMLTDLAGGSPELINDSPQTAPSKRLVGHYPSYRKTSEGPEIVKRIGISRLRKKCSHFDDWVTRLENH